jgi:hypothetical protein
MRRATVLGVPVLLALAFPAPAYARGCSEKSDIVGYERCRRYGDTWAVEHSVGLMVETSISYAWLDPRGRNISGDLGKGQTGRYSYAGSLVGHNMSALPWTLRLGYAFRPWLYAGGEGEFGAGSDRLPATTSNGYAISPSSTGINTFSVGGGAYVGLRLPLSYVALRAETLFGGRYIEVNQNVRALASSTVQSASSSLGVGLIEPRFFIDFWVDPAATVSLYGGFNGLHTGDRIGGLMIGLHGRHYDGGFGLW